MLCSSKSLPITFLIYYCGWVKDNKLSNFSINSIVVNATAGKIFITCNVFKAAATVALKTWQHILLSFDQTPMVEHKYLLFYKLIDLIDFYHNYKELQYDSKKLGHYCI